MIPESPCSAAAIDNVSVSDLALVRRISTIEPSTSGETASRVGSHAEFGTLQLWKNPLICDSGRLLGGWAGLDYGQESAPTELERRIALGAPLSIEDLKRIERNLNLHHAKWDTHVGDCSVLSPEPMLIHEDEWQWLCAQAEAATQELFGLEREIAGDEKIQKLIGVPRNLRRVLRENKAGVSVRTVRFDFHPTASGWVISEVNSDVPGGFGEASVLPSLYKDYVDWTPIPTDPLKKWGDAIEEHCCLGTAALLCAPGFLEDEQVVRILARELRDRGYNVRLIQSPFSLKWERGSARLRADSTVKINCLVRFYQVEWLSQLPSWTGWKDILKAQHRTLVVNPAISAVSESKRLGLCLHRVSARTDTFKRLLPECREPSEIIGMQKEDWALKATYSNTGDEVHLGSNMTADDWTKLLSKARRESHRWVAQRRFETLALSSATGPVKPCIGVFVIGDRAAGAYVRLSQKQVIDGYALEAPLFLMRAKGTNES